MYKRYAIYDCPEGALGAFGAAWLGSGRALVERPARYGFHATLKAPFALAEGQSEGALAGALKALAAGLSPVGVTLELARLGSFFALVPQSHSEPLTRLAGASVLELEAFRAPMTAAEYERKLRPSMSAQKLKNLKRWGYPYVLEDFRYHLTLTGPVAQAERASVRAELDAALPDLSVAHRIGSICLCGEDAAGQFHMIQRFPLSGA
ncbi:DUF1045 domain-containing protein [Lentibacter sp.]|uniref:DUF1045 domain-containing protein n=1 Tax=Lentibacter sp. TaxID=2024994 RepID=UPI003F6A45FF